MRLRAVTTAACALALVITVPGSASAETSCIFYYTYTDSAGVEKQTTSEQDPFQTCINIPEATDEVNTKPAHSPINKTHGVAYAYEETECSGAKFVLESDASGGASMKFRSMYFPAAA
ncbi:hypothetical protein ACH4XT_40490 [Streptomyces avidinii]|uniref:hypothetical protein n=1 Tax=Streptomyces avidinii TaxID=1895 RepID=UPI0037BA9D43